MKTPNAEELFDLTHTLAAPLLSATPFPYTVLTGLGSFLRALGESLPKEEYEEVREGVWIARGVSVAPTAQIEGPTVVGKGAQIRAGAYLRGSVLVGENAVVGNSCELKNAVLFDCAQVPHFNYVGDSILGYRAHLGAGVILSNVRLDKRTVSIKTEDGRLDTGLKKFGALVGDYSEIGSKSVLNPGSLVGRRALVYPLSSVIGVVNEDTVYPSNAKWRGSV